MSRRSGQAYLESLLAVLLLLLALFGALQTALLFGEREVMHHAAARAARARTVGFNDWMAEKAARVASIPVSGRLLSDAVGWDGGGEDAADSQAAFELARIPFYLGAENRARAEWILDYEEWKNGRFSFSSAAEGPGGGVLEFRALHDAPLSMPLGHLAVPFSRMDDEGVPRFPVEGRGVAGNHSGYYLEGSR